MEQGGARVEASECPVGAMTSEAGNALAAFGHSPFVSLSI